MELIPSFVVFIVALLWKSDQDTKLYFAERDRSDKPEDRNAGKQDGAVKS